MRLIWFYSDLLLNWLFRFIYGLEVYGLKNIPQKGPFIVAANHRSNWDPPVLGAALFKKEVNFISKKSLFNNKLFAMLISYYNAFPVDTQGFDREAIKKFIELLRDGRVVVIFPEGTRSRTGVFLPPKSGIGYVAMKMKVPVLPALIWGTHEPMIYHILRIRPYFVAFSKPLYPPDVPLTSKSAQEFSEKIMDEIKKLALWK